MRESAWFSLEDIAAVEISSENPDHLFERALDHTAQKGWRAAEPGLQVIRLRFDQPQTIKRVRLEFLERDIARTQEFALTATTTDGVRKELVRQQWSFAPRGGSSSESEDYAFDLKDVAALELTIDPGRHDTSVFASLQYIGLA